MVRNSKFEIQNFTKPMIKHLYSKLALTLYVIVAIGLAIWAYTVFKDRDGKVPTVTPPQQQTQSNNDNTNNNTPSANDQSSSSDANNNPTSDNNNPSIADNTTNTNSSISADKNAKPVSPTPEISGSKIANITPEHCDNNCQAFAIDLKLFEYCEQSCGISPVKNVSSCDDKKDIQKDYCLKDLAITKKDASQCDKINDANIKQACKNRIIQDVIENQ